VIETLQVEAPVQLHDAPKLLIEWSPRWEEFVTSIRPALSRSTARLAGETPFGLLPYRGILASWAVESFLLFLVIVLPMKLAKLRPYVAPQIPKYEVIYYSGDELPRTEDLAGAQSGTSGKAGGSASHHRTQTIRVARGGSLLPKVVDAPDLKLPASHESVANLLSIRPDPGPPPAEGLRSSRPPLTFPATIVAPTPNVTRDSNRNIQSLNAVVSPAPDVRRDQTTIAPILNSGVIAPAPNVSRDRTLAAPALNSAVVPPAPAVSRQDTRSAPALSSAIVPPAPGVVSREISRSPVQTPVSAVIPPPVSAPEREAVRNAKLNMPAPSIIAPPPSADLSRDLHALASGNVVDPAKAIVPPPPTTSGSGSLMNSLLGKIFGTTDVVPPPPSVTRTEDHGRASQTSASLATNVVPPPPSVSRDGSSSTTHAQAATSLTPSVVPPPPSVSDPSRANPAGGSRNPGGTLLASNVVPPPPSVNAGSGLSSLGKSAKGAGLGGPLDVGSPSASASSGGSGGGSGAVVSTQPGAKVGIPNTGGKGSLSMSPSGGDKPGLGAAGEGSGIGRGKGRGSGMTGEGSGAGKAGSGRGNDPSAHGGISPTKGPGDAGDAVSGTPPVPGVSVSGGSAMVTLPGFGANSSDPNMPARSSSVKQSQGPAITIVATSRSGGAFNFYGQLPGDNYTVYVDTAMGTVVMQFADPTSAAHPYTGGLTGPQALRADLPAGLQRTRLVIACILDASGNLKNLRVLEPGPAEMTARVMAALPAWKFRPAMHGDKPVEVNAILGFAIDTNDRY
jgi:hypothetical protein